MLKLKSLVHPEWVEIIQESLTTMDKAYLNALEVSSGWLPGLQRCFAAFSQPISSTRTILLGESPYPRLASANGYAFWDAAVGELWSDSGLNTVVNRATSLRNVIKMLLVARGDLQKDCSQAAIAQLDKSHFIKTAAQLFNAMMDRGFLLLNASLVYGEPNVAYHAKHWRPFMEQLLARLSDIKPDIHVLLLGRIALNLNNTRRFSTLVAEHPYNLSFITNPEVLAFFKPLDLLYEG